MKSLLYFILFYSVSCFSQKRGEMSNSHILLNEHYYPKAEKQINKLRINKVTNEVRLRISPSDDLPIFRGKTVGTNDTDYEITTQPVYVDSTVRMFYSNFDGVVNTHNYGVTFDPKSIIFTTDFSPLVKKNTAYTLETVLVAGIYQRRGHKVDDTLYVDVVWGDTANRKVFSRWGFVPDAAPLNDFGIFSTAKYISNKNKTGRQINFSAPNITNRISIKHILTKEDSISLEEDPYLPIPLNGSSGQLIPAGNIVSVNVSFSSGGKHSNGDYSYVAKGSNINTNVSGWASLINYQKIPEISTFSDILDGYDDFGTGKNYPTVISKYDRYNLKGPLDTLSTDFAYYGGYWIDFSIRFDDAVGLSELENTGFLLGQNNPNPFNQQSSVNYQLVKQANNVTFTVTDIAGKIISSEKVSNSIGTHTVKLGTYASGLYYYTLNVDGVSSTKKFVVD